MTPAPPRPELIALLDAVKDHPDEDTPRLVLADWLDEQDNDLDAARARFLRADIARARTTPPISRPPREQNEAEELYRRLSGSAGEFAAPQFELGLPYLLVHGQEFVRPDFRALLADEVFAFVQFVRFHDAGGARLKAIAAVPELRFVPAVSVHPFNALGVDMSVAFFGSPHLTGLRQLDFSGVRPGAAGTEALANNPALARLRKLYLVHNKLVEKAAAALAGSPHLANLTHLNLSDNNIGDKGAEALAASPHLANLRELNLRDNPRLTALGKAAVAARFGLRAVF